jgi:hypothetical protein
MLVIGNVNLVFLENFKIYLHKLDVWIVQLVKLLRWPRVLPALHVKWEGFKLLLVKQSVTIVKPVVFPTVLVL